MPSTAWPPQEDSNAGEPVASLHASTLAKLNGNGQAGTVNGHTNGRGISGLEPSTDLRAPRPKYASGAPPSIIVPRLNRPYDEHETSTRESTPQSSPLDSKFSPTGSGRPSTASSPTHTARRERFGQLGNSPTGSPLARSEGFPSSDIRMPSRRSTTSDRNRPSTLAPLQPRRHTSLQYGRRPTLVTGGYESSTDEDDPAQALGTGARSPTRRLTITPTRSNSTASSAHAAHGHSSYAPSPPHKSRTLNGTLSLPHQQLASSSGRRRAQSLISPALADQSAPPTPRRQSRLRAQGGVGLGSPMSGRGAGMGSSPRLDGSAFAPRLEAPTLSNARSGSLRGLRDAVREEPEREKRERSPATSHTERRRSKSHSRQGNTLTASLGLGQSPQQQILSPDQLQDLLGNADLASALQLMAPPAAAPVSRIFPAAHEPLQPALGHEAEPEEAEASSLPRPFLVSAPPALTNGEWPGRPRAASNTSSLVVQGPSRLSGPRHRTVSGTTSIDSDGMPQASSSLMHSEGNIDERREEEEEQQRDDYGYEFPGNEEVQQQQQPASNHHSAAPSSANPDEGVSEAPRTVKPLRVKERHRISSFFGLRKKEKDKAHAESSLPDSVRQQPTPVPAPSHSDPPQHLEAAAAPRRIDPEEQMRLAEQQRREEELAQERRYKALMQIHAHPAAGKRAQKVSTHLDAYYSLIYDGINNPPKMNPLAVLRWKKRTKEQKDARAKWEADNLKPPSVGGTSVSPSRPGHTSRNSLSSSYNRALSPRPSNGIVEQEAQVAPGWYYSLNDVVAYNDCGGRVDFFIPPAPPVEEPKQDGGRGSANLSTSVKSSQSHEGRSRPSFGSDERGRDLPPVSTSISDQLPPSSGSLILVPDNYMSQEDLTQPSTPNRSRGGSVDNSAQQHQRHRHVQSMSGAPQPSTLQALRALPKQLGSSALVKLSSALEPDDFGSRRFAPESPAHSSRGHNRSQSLAHSHTRGGTRDRIRNKIGNIRSGEHNNTTGTSEDEHHHFRKLIARGQRRVEEWTQRPNSTEDGDRIYQEQRDLEETLKRERESRDRQMKRRPTIVELQAQERLEELDRKIYMEKIEGLKKAKHRLSELDDSQEQLDTSLSHYLAQLGQVRSMFMSAADIDVVFNNLPSLPRMSLIDDEDEDETADELYPLRSDSETGYRSFRPRRQGSLPPHNLPVFAMGMQAAWPKRSVVDPVLCVPVDPIRRLELSCDKAREVEHEMKLSRQQATESLQQMVNTVNQLIRQKDIIRGWVRNQLDAIQALKDEKANVQLKIKGGIKPRLWTWRFQDVAIDTSARTVMSFLSYLIRTYNLGRRVFSAGWMGWSLIVAVIAMVGFFYYVGDT